MKAFATCEASVLKWCLNRPSQAKLFQELQNFAGLDSSTECYKPLRSNEISKSEKHVSSLLDVLENEYLNPFSVSIDENELYNLSSGLKKENGVEELLEIQSNGKNLADEFLEKRILTSDINFHEPLRKVKVPSFQEPTITLKKNNKDKVVSANRNIISKFLSLPAKFHKPIDFQKALTYPLHSFPLSMAFPNGSKRETQKSKLLQEILPQVDDSEDIHDKEDILKSETVYIVDMISQLRVCLPAIPDSFEQLIWRFLQSLPKDYHRVDIVADTYWDKSIKSAERIKRGTSSKVLIGSVKSKVPREINKFMLNNDNKASLIKLMFEYVINEKENVISLLMTESIVLSGDDESYTVSCDSVIQNDDLKSNQEEADTKVILHAIHAIKNSSHKVVLRSPSGDTDIIILALALINEQHMVYMDYWNGKRRKGFWLNNIILKENERKALIGFHSFTANDFVPAFFRKGKKRCWSILRKDEKFLVAFSELGRNWELTGEIVTALETYVCILYGSKENSVDAARLDMFMKKQTKENKLIDLSVISPCFNSLYLQMKRANYVAAVWKRTEHPQILFPSIEEHDWQADGSVNWIEEPFPDFWFVVWGRWVPLWN